jgi:hypothetical protein
MIPPDFVTAVAGELKQQGAAFDPADLTAFVADAWPRFSGLPEPLRCAHDFIQAGKAALPA